MSSRRDLDRIEPGCTVLIADKEYDVIAKVLPKIGNFWLVKDYYTSLIHIAEEQDMETPYKYI